MKAMKDLKARIETLETQLAETRAELALTKVRLMAAHALKQEAFELLRECEAKTEE